MHKGCLTLRMLGKNFNRQQFKIFIIFFPQNKIWQFMQIVSKGPVWLQEDSDNKSYV